MRACRPEDCFSTLIRLRLLWPVNPKQTLEMRSYYHRCYIMETMTSTALGFCSQAEMLLSRKNALTK